MPENFTLHTLLEADSLFLMDFPLCKLMLCNDSAYPWFILVPRVADIKDIYELSWEDQQQLLNESSMLSEVLMQLYKGDKMNVAALGNVCPQLHIHHIVRFKSDVAWPNPVWGFQTPTRYSEEEINIIKSKVLPLMETILSK